MQVGFFFWPYTLDLCEQLAERADRYGYAMIGIADTPGNAMDPWVSAAMVARVSRRARVAVCVTNLLTRLDKPWVVDLVSSWSVMTHFQPFTTGMVDSRDVIFFLLIIGFALFTNGVIIRSHRAG